MTIRTNPLSLAQLFANSNEQFIVPLYQRRYSWRIHHVAAIFNDILTLKDNDGHLFGMLILHSQEYNGAFMQPELVDGQQRMISLSILLKSMENAFSDLERNETASEIKKMLQCKGADKIVKNKLLLGDLDEPDYKIVMSGGDRAGIVNLNIKHAIEHFEQCFSKLTEEKLDEFFNKLINVAVIIRLDVSKAKDAYKLFETINNRGLKLSATDLIKNLLLGHASKLSEPETLDTVKTIWTQIITDLDGINTDIFFRQYFCSILKRKIPLSKLVQEFKNYYLSNVIDADVLGDFGTYVSDDDALDSDSDDIDIDDIVKYEIKNDLEKISIIEFLSKIRTAAAIYAKIIKLNFDKGWINDHLLNLSRIQSFPSYIFLMHFLQKDYSKKDMIVIFKMLETLMLRRHICERKTGENDFIFSHLMFALEKEEIDEIIHEMKETIIDFYPSDSDFQDKLTYYQFKGKVENRARYILEQIEYELRGNTNETKIKDADDVHLEHIIPQTISTKRAKDEYGDWVNYLGSNSIIKHKKYVSIIGNLTLLSAPLNIQASNNPFLRKKDSYKRSSLKVANELAKRSDFKFSHVEQRSKDISKRAIDIWNINFKDINTEI